MSAMQEALDVYLSNILNDYIDFNNRNMKSSDDYKKQAIDRFEKGLSIEYGRKYAKIVSNGSVHSFVVLEDDKQFKRGDILKAAGWNTPAKNAARGNIFGKYFTLWTGAPYMRG